MRQWDIVTFVATLLLVCYAYAFGASETVKKFELTSTLELLYDDPCKSSFPCPERWSLGSHIAIVSNDGSIKQHMNQLRGRRVRIIVYEVAQ